MKIKFLILFVLLLQSTLFFSCKKDENNTQQTQHEQNVDNKEDEVVLPESIEFTSLPSKKQLYEASTFKLKYTVNPSAAINNFEVTFSSSNKDVAKVSNTGNITALKAGKTTISAEINGVKAEFQLTVLHVVIDNFDVLYSGSSIIDRSLSFTGYESKEISLENLQSQDMDHASYAMLNFDYDKEFLNIVVDNQTVSITPLKVGNTQVKIFTSDIEKTFDVSVNAIKATAMVLDKSSLEVKAGEDISLNVSLLPENTTDRLEDLNVSWKKTGDLNLSIKDNVSKASVKVSSEQAAGVSKATIEVSATGLEKVSCNLVYVSDFELEFVLFDESGKVVETYSDNIPILVPFDEKICLKGTNKNILDFFEDVEFEIVTSSTFFSPKFDEKNYFIIRLKSNVRITDTREDQVLKVKIPSLNKEFTFNLINNLQQGLYLEYEDYNGKIAHSEKIFEWAELNVYSGRKQNYDYSYRSTPISVVVKYEYESNFYYRFFTLPETWDGSKWSSECGLLSLGCFFGRGYYRLRFITVFEGNYEFFINLTY